MGMVRKYRLFGISFSLFVLSVLGLNLWADPFGLIHAPVEEFIRGNLRDCAVDVRLIPEGAQKKFKSWLLAKIKPANIVVGSSRTFKVRRTDFRSGGYVSFAMGGLALDSYPGLTDMLEPNRNLATVVLGIEFYAYGNQDASARTTDRLLSLATKFGLHEPALRTALYLYKLRGSPYFTTPFNSAWNILTEYISLPATKRSISILAHRFGNGRELHELTLPQNSVIESHCLLSASPQLETTEAWDPRDASIYQFNDILGKRVPLDDFREYNPDYFHGGHDVSNHWNLLVGFHGFSEFKLAVLDRFLRDFELRGVHVIGFTPPFPEAIMNGFRQTGLMPLWDEFNRRVSAIFAMRGQEFIEVHSARELGCDDFRDFDDPWHPDRRCMKSALQDVQAKAKWRALEVKN